MKKYLIFVVVVIGMFTMGCNAFMLAGLLPQISQTLGEPIAAVGQGITVFSLAYFLSAPLFAVLLSNKPIKRSIQIALVIFLLGNLITLMSKSLVLFLLGRVFAGIGAGIFTPLCITMAVNCSDPSFRGRVISLGWSANSIGVVLGVPLGLSLASFFNWQWSIAYVIAFGLLTLVGFSLQKTDIQLPVMPSIAERFHLLCNRNILFVIAMTCCIAVASLGLYSYVAAIQSGSPHSLAIIVFTWGLGGFIGSSFVGFFIDFTKKPQMIMMIILVGLIFSFVAIPFANNLHYIGLIPFFIWGVFGWAVTTPQQHILFALNEKQGAILAALNTSALGLGSALGTAIGGLIIASGVQAINLPFFSAMLLLIVLSVGLLYSPFSRSDFYEGRRVGDEGLYPHPSPKRRAFWERGIKPPNSAAQN